MSVCQERSALDVHCVSERVGGRGRGCVCARVGGCVCVCVCVKMNQS